MLAVILVGFIVIVGLACVATALRLAVRPSEQGLAVLRPLSASTAFASLTATFAGLGMTLKNVADMGPGLDSETMLVAGLAEASVPAALGFSLLAVAWLLAAVGLRRPE